MIGASIVQTLRNYCNVLCDDGMSDGDYVEQRGLPGVLKLATYVANLRT